MENTFEPGIYHFQRQELVASFRFDANGRFEFFYSYGVADRQAAGMYQVEGSTIKLQSEKEPGHDFEILLQEQREPGIHICVKDPNPYLAGYVTAIYFTGNEQYRADCDNRNQLFIEKADKVFLQHLIFPDIACLLKDETNPNTYFEIGLRPSLQQVSFKGIDLFVEADGLRCHPNYLLPMEGILFRKINN